MCEENKNKDCHHICHLCNGTGRIQIKVKVLPPRDYIWRNERCPICEGKGYIEND
jgi:DnaJ-class molecular chaperone